MAFNKNRANDRKTWLIEFNTQQYIDNNQKNIRYKEFINKELVQFSLADNARSISNIMDGLKTS